MSRYVDDFKRISKLLLSDMYDDWYPDPVESIDLLKEETIRELIRTINLKNAKSEVFDVPKQSFMLRYSLEQRIHERYLYHAIATKIIPFTDPLLQESVFGYRYDPIATNRLFKPFSMQWKDWNRGVQVVFDKNKGFLVVVDISNFFEFIRIDDLVGQLRRLDKKHDWAIGRDINDLSLLLKRCSLYKGIGIPQNRDPSSHFANIYLLELDQAIESMDVQYFRYMDDIKVVCKTDYEARKVLKTIIHYLRKLGLSVNSKKTKIIDYANEELREIELPRPDYELESIDILTKPYSPLDSRIKGANKLIEIIGKEFAEDRFESRNVRFCCTRLSKLLRSGVTPSGVKDIKDSVLQKMGDYPWMAKSFYNFLEAGDLTSNQSSLVVDFIKSEKNTLYGFGMFYLWRLAYLKMPEDVAVRNIARVRIADQGISNEEKGSMSFYFDKCNDYSYLRKTSFGLMESASSLLRRSSSLLSSCLSEKDKKEYQLMLTDDFERICYSFRTDDDVVKGKLVTPLKEILTDEEYELEFDIENEYAS